MKVEELVFEISWYHLYILPERAQKNLKGKKITFVASQLPIADLKVSDIFSLLLHILLLTFLHLINNLQ